MNLYSYLEEKLENDKKTILIYHGLNGNIDKEKIKYLTNKGFHVIMEKHDYRREYGTIEVSNDRAKSFMQKQEQIARKADIIIGTSFGGYVAYLLGCQLQKDIILINPALNRKVTKTAIQDYDYPFNEKKAKRIEYFHGANDTTVTAKTSIEVLEKPSLYYKETVIPEMEHKVPFKKFKTICKMSKILNLKEEENETI